MKKQDLCIITLIMIVALLVRYWDKQIEIWWIASTFRVVWKGIGLCAKIIGFVVLMVGFCYGIFELPGKIHKWFCRKRWQWRRR